MRPECENNLLVNNCLQLSPARAGDVASASQQPFQPFINFYLLHEDAHQWLMVPRSGVVGNKNRYTNYYGPFNL